MPGIAGRYKIEDAPTFLPRPYSLLTAATVLPFPDRHAENGVTYDPEVCDPADAWAVQCAASTVDKFTGAGMYGPGVEADPVVVYAAASCSKLGGFTADQVEARAREQLIVGESHTLERIFQGGTNGVSPSLQGATDLTPATGALNPVPALSVLEGAIAENSMGQGMVYAPPAVVPFLSTAITRNGSRFETTGIGTAVAVGSGFQSNIGPTGTEAEAGEAWLYATGSPLTIWRSDIYSTPLDDFRNNNQAALAERTYVMGFSCGAYAVRVALGCCPC